MDRLEADTAKLDKEMSRYPEKKKKGLGGEIKEQENYFPHRGASSYSESNYCSPVEGVPASGRVLELVGLLGPFQSEPFSDSAQGLNHYTTNIILSL